jgi:steroid delta-isomerase-like uncharacterized protein
MSTAQMKAHIQGFYEDVVNKHNPDAIDIYFAPDYVNHGPSPEAQIRDRESLKQFFVQFFTAFPDVRVTLHQMVAEGDMVAWRATVVGTHKGDLMGIPATGKQVNFEEYHLERVRDGKMAEHWGLLDLLTMMQQIGVIPAAAQS